MTPLESAWSWYEETTSQLRLLYRMADRYWEELPWEGRLGRDDKFRDIDSTELKMAGEDCLRRLDDLAVIALFSGFERMVRGRLRREVEVETELMKHPALKGVVEDFLWVIQEGSFNKVLDGYKGLDVDLVEQVKQVRRYRNWVAHGRGGNKPESVSPTAARERLTRFLDRMGGPAADDRADG